MYIANINYLVCTFFYVRKSIDSLFASRQRNTRKVLKTDARCKPEEDGHGSIITWRESHNRIRLFIKMLQCTRNKKLSRTDD